MYGVSPETITFPYILLSLKGSLGELLSLLCQGVCGAAMTGRWASRMHLEKEPWNQEPHLLVLMLIVAHYTQS